jgi:hypothetical protein
MQLNFDSVLFPWDAKPSVVFVALPQDHADAIDHAVSSTGGFGSVKVNARIGETEWSTSLFPNKELESYVLPLKAAVRKKEKLKVGDVASVTIELVHV